VIRALRIVIDNSAGECIATYCSFNVLASEHGRSGERNIIT
jgi:hypothetical protein